MNKKTIPFMVLGIFHFILFVITFIQKKQKTLLVFFSSVGIAYVFEYFVLNLFRMYTYYPKVFKNKWIDSVFGALLSQSVYIPIKATFLVLFNLGWKWSLVSTFLFGVVERIFIHLGVFKNNTWKTLYTVLAIPVYYFIVNKWWEGLKNKNAKVIPVISLFFCYWINYTNIYFFLLALCHKFIFRIGFLKNKYWEHFILVPLYTFYQSIIGTMNTLYFPKRQKALGLLWLHVSDQLMFKLNLIRTKKRDIYMFIPLHIVIFLLGEYFLKLIYKTRERDEDGSYE